LGVLDRIAVIFARKNGPKYEIRRKPDQKVVAQITFLDYCVVH
jgi:hypothetical protein